MRDVVNEKIIVALDNSNTFEQLHIVENLGDKINFYKIGLGSLSSGGLALANELKSMGKRIFLDLKLFDIGNILQLYLKLQHQIYSHLNKFLIDRPANGAYLDSKLQFHAHLFLKLQLMLQIPSGKRDHKIRYRKLQKVFFVF